MDDDHYRKPPQTLATLQRLILLSDFVQALSYGTVAPFILLYLHFSLGFSTSIAGLAFGFSGLVSLVAALIGGVLQDHLGDSKLTAVAVLLEAMGLVVLAVSKSTLPIFLGFTLIGLSSIKSSAANSFLTNALRGRYSVEKFFSYQFTAINAGFATGAFLGGLLANPHLRSQFVVVLFGSAFLSALSSLPYFAAKSTPKEAAPSNKAGYVLALKDERLRTLLTFNFLLSFASYGSFEAGFPAFVGLEMRKDPHVIAAAFVANPIAIVLLQHLVYRFSAKLGTRRQMTSTAAAFAFAWIFLLATSQVSSAFLSTVFMGIFGLIFAFGEMLYSPIRAPLIDRIARKDMRSRYFALAHLARASSELSGPTVAGYAIGNGLGYFWVPAVAAVGLLSALSAQRFNKAVKARPT